jgi:phospholipid/cholesterol/gamma-HCH transport system permease protein
MKTIEPQAVYQKDANQLICKGDWDIANLPQIISTLKQIAWPASGKISVDGTAVKKMDSAGAWLLLSNQKALKEQGISIELDTFPTQCQKLLSIVQHQLATETKPTPITPLGWVARIGKDSYLRCIGFMLYLAFIGRLSLEVLRLMLKPSRFRWRALVSTIYRNGFQALPIVTLLSFMIGVVITYQMGLQLKNYGANIFIVDLLGLSILREFGPLLTSIMVAGRTGSAFTAQLGMMKINQEIDALDTMGVTPGELLLLPRIFGLTIALPLLTMWADIFGIIGGMVMASVSLDITWYDFLQRFPTVIPLRALLLGLFKTPIFALIIASIGCFQGMQVGGSADSVGQNTTKSVVLSIFFIIVADALFSIIFSKLHL